MPRIRPGSPVRAAECEVISEGVYQPAARFDAGVAGPPEGPHVQEYAPAFGSSRALASNRSRRLVSTLSALLSRQPVVCDFLCNRGIRNPQQSRYLGPVSLRVL